jgi:hypothetical protein
MNNTICDTLEEYKITFPTLLKDYVDSSSGVALEFFDGQMKLYELPFHFKIDGVLIEKKDHEIRKEEIYNFIKVKIAELKYGKPLEEVEVDLSDARPTEQIIYLQRLGIIDFLLKKQPFASSQNSLSTVLSAVTGIPITSLSPLLRRTIQNDQTDSKNPLYSVKAVLKVETNLKNVGFDLEKKN